MSKSTLKALITTLVLAAGVASAQGVAAPAGKNFTAYYSTADLMTRPGLITLGKGGSVLMDFPDNIDAVVTAQGALLDIPEPLGNLLFVTAKVSTGQANITVRLENGTYAVWQITFTSGMTPLKRIKVEDAPVSAPAPVTSAPSAGPNTGLPIYLPASVTQAPATAAPSAATAAQPVSVTPPLNRAQPQWLTVTADVRRALNSNTLLVTVRNSGPRTLTLAPADLSVSVSGVAQAVDVTDTLTVGPNETRTYEVRLSSAVENGPVSVEWLAYDQAANTYYRVASK